MKILYVQDLSQLPKTPPHKIMIRTEKLSEEDGMIFPNKINIYLK